MLAIIVATAWLSIGGWERDADELPVSIGEHAAAYIGGEACLFGGRTTTGVSSSTLCSDIARKSRWRRRAALPSGRSGLAAASLGHDAAAIVGGLLATSRPTADALIYNITDDRWTALPSMPTARNGLEIAVVTSPRATELFAIGGVSSVYPPGAQHLAVVEALDILTLRWRARARMARPRAGFGIAVVGRSYASRVFVAGGSTVGHAALRSAEVYSTAADAWSELPELVRARSYLGLAFLSVARAVPVTVGRGGSTRAPPDAATPGLLAFGGTNCSTKVFINGTARCESIPTSEWLRLPSGEDLLPHGVRAPTAWTVLTNGDLAAPVHATALLGGMNDASACIAGGETDSDIFTTAVQCYYSS